MKAMKAFFLFAMMMPMSMWASKDQAPVSITAQVGNDSTVLTLTFARAATGVEVHVRGVNGLSVNQEYLAIGKSYASGQTVQFTVGHSSTPGHHDLSVEVSGNFNGLPAHRIQSFTVGDKNPASPGYKIVAGSNGKPVIEMQGSPK